MTNSVYYRKDLDDVINYKVVYKGEDYSCDCFQSAIDSLEYDGATQEVEDSWINCFTLEGALITRLKSNLEIDSWVWELSTRKRNPTHIYVVGGSFTTNEEDVESMLANSPKSELKSFRIRPDEFHPEDFQTLTGEEKQGIINPKHYQMIPAGNYPNGIQYMGIVAFLLSKKEKFDRYESHIYSQILKYLLRLGEKDSIRQDVTKVLWYTNLMQLYQDVKEGTLPLQTFIEQWEIMGVMEQSVAKD